MLTFEKTGKFITFILICTSTICANAGYDLQVNNYYLHSIENDSLIVKQMAGFVAQCQQKYDRYFKFRYRKRVDIYLTRSVEEYEIFNQANIPEWSSGVAYTKLRKIILKPGLYYDPDQYRETLFHEISHMYIAEIIGNGALPVWINEGLSMVLSEKELSWQESIAVGNALSMDNLVDLVAIDTVLLFSNARAQLAYLQSFLAVRYLISKIGETSVAQMVKDFSHSYTLDEVFEKHLGYSYFEFELEWYNDLKSDYRWVSWLQFENFLWLSLVVIIFLAFFLKKIKNRKIVKKWEEEDDYDLEI